MFLVGAIMVGAVWKCWILAFREALKMKFNDFWKSILALPKSVGHGPSPNTLVCGPCLLIYNISILLTFLCKCNSKIDLKGKSNGSYRKLTNKQTNHRKERRTNRYKKLSMELQVQILPCLDVKRYKKLRRIIANVED